MILDSPPGVHVHILAISAPNFRCIPVYHICLVVRPQSLSLSIKNAHRYTEIGTLYRTTNRQGHWVSWMSMGDNTRLTQRAHAYHIVYISTSSTASASLVKYEGYTVSYGAQSHIRALLVCSRTHAPPPPSSRA